jgi:predicted amidophosphoribosyltransferase
MTRDQQREYYQLLKAAHLCPHCKNPAPRGRVYCKEFVAYIGSRQRAARKSKSARAWVIRWQQRRRKRIALGLCARCGQEYQDGCPRCERTREERARAIPRFSLEHYAGARHG